VLSGPDDVEQLVADIAAAADPNTQFAALLGVLRHDPAFDPGPDIRRILGDDARSPVERRAAFLALSLSAVAPHAPDFRSTLEELVAVFDDADYEYEKELTALMLHLDVDPVYDLESILADSKAKADLSYAAFYALNVYYRRMNHLSELEELMKKHSTRFKSRRTISHLQALNYQKQGDLKQARRCAKTAVDKLPEHPGVLHHFAQVVVDLRQRDSSAVDDAMLREASEALDGAITLTNEGYARYFATLARLLTLEGDYDGADRAIRDAIDKEDRGNRDYTLLIGEYQAIRLETEFERSMSRLESQGAGLAEEIESVRSESVQMLGLLAAAIAFIVTSTQIATHAANFDRGGRLFLLVIGGVIVVFSAFSLTNALLRAKRHLPGLAALAVGMLLLSYAVFLWSPRNVSAPAKPVAKATTKGR